MSTTDARKISGSVPIAVVPEEVKSYGRYLLFRKLAEGGMAEIFLAKQLAEKGFERNVVIKRMLAHLGQATDFVDMFLDEARIAAKLQHPNIVAINDFGQIDNRYFICMEYLAGEDFSTVLRTASRKREYVPINVALRVMIDAANGLHFAHTFADESGNPLNIVHRDISPSNIYVTYTGQVKVLDFGIAKAESRVTNTTAGVVKGKYMYMSPEQARGLEVDRRADVFSLGVSLFEALTNVRPFGKDNDLAILNAVLKADFPMPRTLRPDLPSELEGVILKAMKPSLEERYQSAQEFAADLERYLGSSTSASGGLQVGVYLKSLFGEDRMANKTNRVPSLASLAAAGVTVPGFHGAEAKPEPETRAVEIIPVMDTGDVRSKSQLPMRRSSNGTGKAVIASVATAAVLIAGAGGFIAWQKLHEAPAVSQPPVVVSPVVPVKQDPPPKVDPPKQETAKIDPNPEHETKQDVAQKDEADQQQKKAHVPKQAPAGPLTAPEIQKMVSTHYAQIHKCLDTKDPGADEGTVMVKFTILGSGVVTGVGVQGALPNPSATGCLKSQFENLKFRRHPDAEVSLTLPFKWRVAH